MKYLNCQSKFVSMVRAHNTYLVSNEVIHFYIAAYNPGYFLLTCYFLHFFTNTGIIRSLMLSIYAQKVITFAHLNFITDILGLGNETWFRWVSIWALLCNIISGLQFRLSMWVYQISGHVLRSEMVRNSCISRPVYYTCIHISIPRTVYIEWKWGLFWNILGRSDMMAL